MRTGAADARAQDRAVIRSTGDRDGESLWAITTYFNPVGYGRRRENYRQFRKHLKVPLVAVELAFDGAFELGEGDADILVQLRGADVLWQKERLLNLALAALPASCATVAWLDADIIFADDDWPSRVDVALDRADLVQVFSRMHLPPPDSGRAERLAGGGEVKIWPSVVALIDSGVGLAAYVEGVGLPGRPKVGLGLGWAARRALLDRHGFFDACVIGGGDRALLYAAYGCFEPLAALHCMNQRQRQRYLAWARPFHADVRGAVAMHRGRHLPPLAWRYRRAALCPAPQGSGAVWLRPLRRRYRCREWKLALGLGQARHARLRHGVFRLARHGGKGTGRVSGGGVTAGGNFWAITSYYNPIGYRHRRDNYHHFRSRLGVPLLAVELVYGDAPELGPGDADILVQRRGGDVMWQKERLLNIALDVLPPECETVAWVDCDLIFERPDWPERAVAALDRAAFVQLFTEVHYMPRDLPLAEIAPAMAELQRAAIAYSVTMGVDPLICFEGGDHHALGAACHRLRLGGVASADRAAPLPR